MEDPVIQGPRRVPQQIDTAERGHEPPCLIACAMVADRPVQRRSQR